MTTPVLLDGDGSLALSIVLTSGKETPDDPLNVYGCQQTLFKQLQVGSPSNKHANRGLDFDDALNVSLIFSPCHCSSPDFLQETRRRLLPEECPSGQGTPQSTLYLNGAAMLGQEA